MDGRFSGPRLFVAALTAVTIVLVYLPTQALAQQGAGAAVRVSDNASPAPHPPDRGSLDQRVRRLVDKVKPLQDRIVQDDRLRTASGVVGLGIAAYSVSRNRGGLPLGAVGAEALRLGLHRQLTSIRQKSGYSIEPSIGRHGFSITFRKMLN